MHSSTVVEDFVNTQTSAPTAEAVTMAESILGYALPNEGQSVRGDSPVEFTVKQMLLHPALFERLAN